MPFSTVNTQILLRQKQGQMSTQVPALKFDSPCTPLPTAKASVMFCSPPQSGISANRVHNLLALNTGGCYLQVIPGMCQIPSSPSCHTKNKKERDQEKTELIKLPTAQNAPLRRLIFEPVNVIMRSLEVGLRLVTERPTLKEKVWMEPTSFT